MPLYEYECVKCGSRIEVIQRVGDGPIEACAACGGEMKRLLSAPAFQFKGSGWYVTDYAKKRTGDPKTPSKAEKSDSGEGKKKEPSSETATQASKDSD